MSTMAITNPYTMESIKTVEQFQIKKIAFPEFLKSDTNSRL